MEISCGLKTPSETETRRTILGLYYIKSIILLKSFLIRVSKIHSLFNYT